MMVSAGAKLSAIEREDLAECERVVQTGLKASREARAKLRHIREARLYREEFATFEEYAEKRWGFSARHLHRICDWSEVETNLLSDGGGKSDQLVTLPAEVEDLQRQPLLAEGPPRPAVGKAEAIAEGLPAEEFRHPVSVPSESQARVLKRLPKEEQREAWEEATRRADGAKVTARHVEEVVAKKRSLKSGVASRKSEGAGTKGMKGTVEMEAAEALAKSRVWLARWFIADALAGLHKAMKPLSYMVGTRSGPNGIPYHAEKARDHLSCIAALLTDDRSQMADGKTNRAGPVGFPGGWTPDPTKVTPCDSLQKARAHDGDHVMPLGKAVRKFECGL